MKMNRRKFIVKGSSAFLGAGFTIKSGVNFTSGSIKKSKIVEVMHPHAVLENREVNAAVVRKMLRQGMNELVGSQSPWKHFFDQCDRVGLKINTLGRPLLFTHHELIQSVVDELKEFGVKENNILIWDRYERHMKQCNFKFNTSGKGVRCYGTVDAKLHLLEENSDRFDPDMVYESDFDNRDRRKKRSTVSRISSIFTQECDKVINMAILKDHGLAGITMCLKNLAYGLSDNNSRFHGPKHIGPFISEFCALPDIRKKVVLHIIDGLEGCYDTGPVPSSKTVIFSPKTLLLGTDPVALDTIGYHVIDAKRMKKGLPLLKEVRRSTDHIKLAAKRGLGTDNMNRITVKKMKLG